MSNEIQKRDQSVLERIKSVHPDHDLKLTPEGEKVLQNFYRLEHLVDQSAIMTCPGAEDCVWAQSGECPLVNASVELPVKQLCPVETIRFTDSWTELIAGVEDSDPNNHCSYLERALCKRVASLDIQTARVQKEISRRPAATIHVNIPSNAGPPIDTEMDNPAYKTLKTLEGMRGAAIRQLQKAMENRHRIIKSKVTNTDEQQRRDKLKAAIKESAIVDADFEVKGEEKEPDIFAKHAQKKKKHRDILETKIEKMNELNDMMGE